MELDPGKLAEKELYKVMTGCIVPRPIALVTTLGSAGPNAAPFSLFNIVCTDPAMIMFSAGDQVDGTEKDTIRNLRELPECVVHICNEAIARQMNVCATDYPPGENELLHACFTAEPSVVVRPPRIAEAPVQMECRVQQILDLGVRHHMVLAQVLRFHFHEGIVNERFHVDVARLNPIGRLSGSLYAGIRPESHFKLERAFLQDKPAQFT